MNVDDLILVSVDDNVIEPAHMVEGRVPKKYQVNAPLVGIETRHHLNIDNITWECDHPHSDSTWPHAPEVLMKSLGGVPDDEINKMTHLNAIRHFQYNPFAHITRKGDGFSAARSGRNWDVSIKSTRHLRPATASTAKGF